MSAAPKAAVIITVDNDTRSGDMPSDIAKRFVLMPSGTRNSDFRFRRYLRLARQNTVRPATRLT
jgi:hypothetical protein